MAVVGTLTPNPHLGPTQPTEGPTASGLLAPIVEGPITTTERPLTIIIPGQFGK